MLQRTDGTTEPGIVAYRQQQIALRREPCGELRVDHFVADIRRDLQVLRLQQRLAGFAAGEVGHRQVEEGDQAAQQILQRYVLAERHQFLLEVGAAAVAGGGQPVVVAQFALRVGLAYRYAGDQCRIALLGEAGHHLQIAFGVILEDRHGGFRPDDQVCRAAAEGHVAIQQQLHLEFLRVPLHALCDVALHCGDGQRLALAGRPGMVLERQARKPGGEQQHDGGGQACFIGKQSRDRREQGGAQCDGKAQQPDPAERSQSGQRAIQLAVADIQPGKTGEDPAAQGVERQPECGERQRIAKCGMAIAQQAHPEPAEQGEEQRQAGDEAQGEQSGQRRRGRAEVMDADVDPADARGEQPEAVAPAALRRLLRCGFAQAEV